MRRADIPTRDFIIVAIPVLWTGKLRLRDSQGLPQSHPATRRQARMRVWSSACKSPEDSQGPTASLNSPSAPSHFLPGAEGVHPLCICFLSVTLSCSSNLSGPRGGRRICPRHGLGSLCSERIRGSRGCGSTLKVKLPHKCRTSSKIMLVCLLQVAPKDIGK